MVFVASGGVPGAQLKLEQPRTFIWDVTPNEVSASSNTDILFAVTPGATLAEPSEGQLVKPGFRNTGEVILEFIFSVISGYHSNAADF